MKMGGHRQQKLLICLIILQIPVVLLLRSAEDHGHDIDDDEYRHPHNPRIVLPMNCNSGATIFPTIFLFGDSLSDTGNGPFVNHTTACKLPYGETFPGYADGRFSDGRTIVGDFLASYLGLRPVNPWLDVFLDFDEGANYAIPGATVLPDFMPLGLPQQIQWHLDLVAEVWNRTTTNDYSRVPSVLASPSSSSSSSASVAREDHDRSTLSSSSAPSSERKRLPSRESLHDALYVLHIGGLDYKLSYNDQSLPMEYVNASVVPRVVAGLRDALETLYESAGARKLVVMGVEAQGCISSMLGTFPELERDSSGCVTAINSISWNSAQQTLVMLRELAQLRPDASYTFVDLHSATLHIVDHAHAFGFWEPYNVCCGAGPGYPYGRSPSILCSNDTESLYVCPDPITYINWDGLHFTDSFNFQVFNHTFLTGAFMYSIPSSDSMPLVPATAACQRRSEPPCKWYL